jgi:hypothetical protein
MAGAVIGALRVVLGADTAALDKGLKDAQSGLASFGAAVGAGMAAAAAAVVAAGAAISVALGKTINDMDTLSKTSQKLGIPVEQLSALAYAADLSDVSFEALSKGVAKLSKAMVEAGAKPTSDAANAFRALGVSVTDASGRLKSSDVIMGDLAESFSGLKDGAGKTAAAMAIFGKAGADMIPLLNGGRDSLKEMNDEAEQFGAVVSGKAAKQAEAFNDNMTRLGYVIKGVFVQVASQLLPILVDVSNKMVEAAKKSEILASAVDIVSAAMKGLVTSGVIVSATLQVAADTLSIIWGGLARLIKGDVAGAFEHLKTKTGDIAAIATDALGTIKGVWSGAKAGADSAAEATDGAAKAQRDFNFAALGGKNAVDSYIDSQNKSLAGQQAEIQTFGLLAGQREAARIQLQALSIATANHTTISAAQQAQLDLLKQKTADYALTLAGLQLAQQNLTPTQIYAQELTKIQALFDAGKISAETYEQAMQGAAERAGTAWNIAGASMAGSFATISAAFGKESAGMAKAAQIFGAIQATISMFTGAAKALELPFPANIAAVAAVLAKGATLVAQIKSQSVPTGFKDGLSMTVPGGVGGGDTRMFQAMVEPGEQIDITPNRGGRQNARENSAPAVVNLAMGAVSTREGFKAIIDGLNDMVADGYRLNVVSA